MLFSVYKAVEVFTSNKTVQNFHVEILCVFFFIESIQSSKVYIAECHMSIYRRVYIDEVFLFAFSSVMLILQFCHTGMLFTI